MFDMSSFFNTTGQNSPNSALFDPMNPTGQRNLVAGNQLAGTAGINPNTQMAGQPSTVAPAPGTQAAGVDPSAAPGNDPASKAVGSADGGGPLNPMSPPQAKPGGNTNGQDLIDKYSKMGSGGGGLMKLMGMFMGA